MIPLNLENGKWKMENNGYLSLSSSEELSTYFLSMDVKEKVKQNSDSTTFIIDNPIEKHYRKFNEKGGELYYFISMTQIQL